MSRSSVVYNYTCPHCEARYVGSTLRTLHIRTSEHAGRSHRTQRPLSCPPQSSIRDHVEQSCDQFSPITVDNFNIIGSTKDKISLRILESLHILNTKPVLNDTNSAFPLNIVVQFLYDFIFVRIDTPYFYPLFLNLFQKKKNLDLLSVYFSIFFYKYLLFLQNKN